MELPEITPDLVRYWPGERSDRLPAPSVVVGVLTWRHAQEYRMERSRIEKELTLGIDRINASVMTTREAMKSLRVIAGVYEQLAPLLPTNKREALEVLELRAEARIVQFKDDVDERIRGKR